MVLQIDPAMKTERKALVLNLRFAGCSTWSTQGGGVPVEIGVFWAPGGSREELFLYLFSNTQKSLKNCVFAHKSTHI